MKCEECKYWEETENCPELHVGDCRRYPPTCVRKDSLDQWPPETNSNEWCGEFEAKVADGRVPVPFSDAGWPTRIKGVLRRMGIDSWEKLANTTSRDLAKQRNFGETSLHVVRRTLKEYGLSLADCRKEKDQ